MTSLRHKESAGGEDGFERANPFGDSNRVEQGLGAPFASATVRPGQTGLSMCPPAKRLRFIYSPFFQLFSLIIAYYRVLSDFGEKEGATLSTNVAMVPLISLALLDNEQSENRPTASKCIRPNQSKSDLRTKFTIIYNIYDHSNERLKISIGIRKRMLDRFGQRCAAWAGLERKRPTVRQNRTCEMPVPPRSAP